LQKDNNPYIIVQSYCEPNKYIQHQPQRNHFIQTIQLQPIQPIQPIQLQPIQTIQPQHIQTIQLQPIQTKNNIKFNKPLDLSKSTNKFYNLS
jgi:hypothetical protein